MGHVAGYDFCGWATKHNIKCGDGHIIMPGAFSTDDGKKVPMVFNHVHNKVQQVLGHAILENRDEGVYAYCYFNNSEAGKNAKEAVLHGDISGLSIWANNLQKNGKNIMHGAIRELSLVLAGANPGAFIESVIEHSEPMDEFEDEGLFYSGEGIIIHSEEPKEDKKVEEKKIEEPKKDEKSNKTVKQVYDSMNEEQKAVVAYAVGAALADNDKKSKKNDQKEEDEEMGHNAFEGTSNEQEVNYISHSDLNDFIKKAASGRVSSLKQEWKNAFEDGSIIAHSIDKTGMDVATGTQNYGVNDVSMLYPDYRSLNNPPEFISRNMGWVQEVIGKVHRTPFTRIKSMFADITEDEARAKGYIKGKQKKEEVFTTLKRTTTAQTIYKKQKLDKDDIADITDFDIVPWIKKEMDVMLNEEIARAIIIGDGRPTDSDDHISEEHIRPIAKDVPLFNTKIDVKVSANATEAEEAKAVINAAIRGRKKYKGSGNPTLFTTEDWVTEMLLLEDSIGHKLYKTEQELATALRVSKIVTVEVMEGQEIDDKPLIGVIVNMTDYNVGKDSKGDGLFDDFDIDFNQYKYLKETRMSGALIKPFSALTLLLDKAASGSANVGE